MKLKELLKIFNKNQENSNDENKKNPYFIFILCGVGILILIMCQTPKKIVKSENTYDIDKIKITEEEKLGKILSKMTGIKKAYVYLSYENSGISEPLTEEKTVTKNSKGENVQSNSESQIDKKPIYDGNKNIILKSRIMPVIKGVCVFYSGEDTNEIKKNLYNAVQGALGVELHKIQIVTIKE